MITNYNEKSQTLSFCGMTQTVEYFQRVQGPLLVESLHWSPESLVAVLEREGIPLGQFARVGKVQTHLRDREEAREKAEKARKEAEHLAWYNSPEQVAQRARDSEALHQARLKHSQEMRSGKVSRPRGGDVDYAPTIMFD